MWIVPHYLAVLAGAGLGLIGVDHEIMRAAVGLFGHERPFQAGRKAGSAAATQPRSLHLVDDPIAALLEDRFGAVPGATRARPLEAPVVEAVKILEDAVLILEHLTTACWSMDRRAVASARRLRVHSRLRRASWRRRPSTP